MEEILVKVNYYVRERLWGQLKALCDYEIQKGQDAILVFWKAYGTFNEGATTEAIRELTRIQDRRECQFAAAIALIYYHERCRNVDQEQVDTYVLQLEDREDQASDKDLMAAATFCWHTTQLKRAGQITQKLTDMNQNNMGALTIKGWIYLSAPKEELQMKSIQYFDHVCETGESNGRKYLEAMLGRAKFFEKSKKYDDALEVLNEVSVCFPQFQPAVIEKGKCHILSGEWDQAVEAITAVIVTDRQNTEALRIYIFYLLARENDPELFNEKLDELLAAIRLTEQRNSDLIYNISRLFARYSCRKDFVVQRTLELLDMAIMQQPENAAYYAEMGNQKAMLCDFQGAYQAFQKSVSFDESLLAPLYGMINCRIRQEAIDDAAQQLEFVAEISQSQGGPKSAEHAYLEAVIEWRKRGNKIEAIRLIDSSLNLHIAQTKNAPSNIEFYIRLNPDFLMTLAQEYLVHCGVKPKITSAGPPKQLIKAQKLLENVTKQNIAMLEPQVQLSKARWLLNDTLGALRELSDVLQKDPSCVEAHIMAALINSEAGNMRAADNYLKQAFSQDFSIRDNPVFMLMKSEVEMRQKNWDEAITTLDHAFKLPQVQDPSAAMGIATRGSQKLSLPFGQEERARIFLNLVSCYCELKNFNEARKILTRAVSEFADTPEEVRVMLAQSDLAMKMGDTKKALNMLKKIQPGDRSFIQAKKKQAQIYLDELKDRQNYTRCYLEILDAKSSVENFKMVAQALMDIQEPEEAIQYYERALERQSEDTNLVREVGKALVMTHDYNRAVKYYETRLQEDPRLLDLRSDLADLYLKLKVYDQSKRVLIDGMKYLSTQTNDLDNKSRNVGFLIAMARVCLQEDQQYPGWQMKENPDAKQAIIKARSLQAEVIETCRTAATDRIDEERLIGAEISYQLGAYLEERNGKYEDAIVAYNDCLSRDQAHLKSMVALARLYQQTGNNEQCGVFCNRILKNDPSNELATFMQANLNLMKDQTDQAIQVYIQLLEKAPSNFKTLAQLLELLRRAGRITDMQQHIEAAEKVCKRSNLAGLAYCKGLYYRYTGNPQQALRDLNVARFNNLYGVSATKAMIDIYLNPDNEMIFSSISDEQSQYQTTPENITIARELIEELSSRHVDTNIHMCMALISGKQKGELEQAAKQLQELLTQNKEFVPAQVTMGLCKFLQKKSSDARNYLKAVIKNDFQLDNAAFFEMAWLMMADYYISVNKFDLAEQELKKVLKYNKSNVKAEELMGFIKDKEKAYADAAEHYHAAFRMSNCKNASVGFRLAFNYLKAERFVDTVNVSKQILEVYPEFPKVKSELINKARAGMRA